MALHLPPCHDRPDRNATTTIAITKVSSFYNPSDPPPTLPPSAPQPTVEMEKRSNCTSLVFPSSRKVSFAQAMGWGRKIAGAVNQHELDHLGKRFMKLDSDDSGSLYHQDLLQKPHIVDNTVASRIIAVFNIDDDGGGTQELVGGPGALSGRG